MGMMFRLMKGVVVLSLAIFALAWLSWFFIGGGASGGKAADGHFYVDHKGRFIEVTKEAYTYSLLLERGVMVTFPLALIAGCILRHREWKQRQESVLAALRKTTIPS